MKPNKVWPDEGLKAPVKKFSETFSAEGLVLAGAEQAIPQPSEAANEAKRITLWAMHEYGITNGDKLYRQIEAALNWSSRPR